MGSILMKALVINTVCKTGSTGSLAYGLYKYLIENKHEALVCYGRGEIFSQEKELLKIDSDLEVNIHVLLTRLTGLQGYFSNRATKKLEKAIKTFKPDVVYLFNLHGYYLNERRAFRILSEQDIPTVYIMPDEYPFLGKCCFSGECDKYKKGCSACPSIKSYPKSLFLDQSKKIFEMKEEAYKSIKHLSFVSVPYNIQKAKESMLLSDKKMYEHNWGIDLENLYYPRETVEIKKKYSIPETSKVILAVAPFNDERKGIKKYFYECAKQVNSQENIAFVNVGFDGELSVCLDNFIPIKYVSDQEELSQIYSMADLFVITSMADTMPLAALIALGCGTPVCGFDISGIRYLADGENNGCVKLIEPGNIQELLQVIKEIPEKNAALVNACREYALAKFSDKKLYRFLLNIGSKLLKEKNKKYED